MNSNREDKKIFAENLNYYLHMKNLSRRKLSEQLGIPYPTIADWAKGKKLPRVENLNQLAKFFGVSLSDLIEKKSFFEQQDCSINNDHNKRVEISPKTLAAMAQMLGVDIDMLETKEKMLPTQEEAEKALKIALSKTLQREPSDEEVKVSWRILDGIKYLLDNFSTRQ